MVKYLKYIGILIFLGIAVGFYMYNKPHQDMATAKIDIQLPATQLFEAFDTNEEEANTQYLNKVIEVSGKIKEISKDDNGMVSITLESGSDMFGVVCQMDNLTKHQRTEFKEGEAVKFKGICTGVLMDVVLVRCVEV